MNKSGLDIFYDLIKQECNSSKVYEQLLPYPIEIYGKAALKQKFPKRNVNELNIMKLVKQEIIDKTQAKSHSIKV